MFQELPPDSGAQPLVDAEENRRLTMLVGRSDVYRQTLEEIGQRDFRATFLVVGSGVFEQGQEERWFGSDPSVVLALLNFDVPTRTAAERWDATADPFDIGQAVLNLEAGQ